MEHKPSTIHTRAYSKRMIGPATYDTSDVSASTNIYMRCLYKQVMSSSSEHVDTNSHIGFETTAPTYNYFNCDHLPQVVNLE
jgi:hypothetical protein